MTTFHPLYERVDPHEQRVYIAYRCMNLGPRDYYSTGRLCVTSVLCLATVVCSQSGGDLMSGCRWRERPLDFKSQKYFVGQSGLSTAMPSGGRTCEVVKSSSKPNNTELWSPAFFPSSAAYFKLPAFEWLHSRPNQLGQHDQRLPVSHRTTVKPGLREARVRQNKHHRQERGVWFYYANGCSDLHYHVGQTLAAKNKIDAALRLAGMVSADVPPARRVAQFLRQGSLRPGSRHLKARYESALDPQQSGGAMRTLETLLQYAASGPFWIDDDGERMVSAAFCNRTFMRLSGGGSRMTDWLDTFSEPRRSACVDHCALAELGAALILFEFLDAFLINAGRAAGFDSIQLLQQPQGGYAFFSHPWRWSVEVLDLRTARTETNQIERRPDQLLKHLSGPASDIGSITGTAPDSKGTAAADVAIGDRITSRPSARPSCRPACWFAACMACEDTPIAIRNCIHQSEYVLLPPQAATNTSSVCERSPRLRKLLAPKGNRISMPLVAFFGMNGTCTSHSIGATTVVREASRYLAELRRVSKAGSPRPGTQHQAAAASSRDRRIRHC